MWISFKLIVKCLYTILFLIYLRPNILWFNSIWICKKFKGNTVMLICFVFSGHKAHKVGANLRFLWLLADRWLSPSPGQDVSLSLETSSVKLVPTYTWVEWGNGGELSSPRIKLAAQTPGIEPKTLRSKVRRSTDWANEPPYADY